MLAGIKNIAQRNINFIIAIIYCASILFLSSRHAVWRDEVRAFSIATDCPSFLSMPTCLRNEGHPFLWYFFVRLGNILFQDPVSLKITNLLICSFGVCFFIFKSPFSSLQKFLFAFGFFPLHQYAVVNRGYALSMALMFLIADFYSSKFKRPVLFATLLFLLANSEFYGLLIAISIVLGVAIEAIVRRKTVFSDAGSLKPFCYGGLIALVGIVFSIIQIYPDQLSDFQSARSISLQKILHDYKNLIFAGDLFSTVANVFFIPAYLTVWIYYLLLLPNPLLLLINIATISGLALSHTLIYPLHIHHHGFLLLLIVCSFWISRKSTINDIPLKSLQLSRLLSAGRSALLYAILIAQVCSGYFAIRKEISSSFSNSSKAGNYIRQSPELQDAIIIGQPDYYLESLPYYVDNQIFVVRENRFSKIVKFTSENSSMLSLQDLLMTAENLKTQYNKPVLISLGFELSMQPPFEKVFSGNRKFTYSKSEVNNFFAKTTALKRFKRGTVSRENYYLYLLK